MDKDKKLARILNDVVDSVNGGDGGYLETNEVMCLRQGERINRLSQENRPGSEAGARVLDF